MESTTEAMDWTPFMNLSLTLKTVEPLSIIIKNVYLKVSYRNGKQSLTVLSRNELK